MTAAAPLSGSTAHRMASMLFSTSVAVTSEEPSPRAAASCAFNSRRAPISNPSIRDEATASARSSNLASASESARPAASRLRRSTARSASATSPAVSPLKEIFRPAKGSGKYAS